MKKIIGIILSVILISGTARAQKFGYVDTDYILGQIPEYKSAQKQLDEQAEKWQKEAEEKQAALDAMYREYNAEKLLLTPAQCKEREDAIVAKETEVNQFKDAKFGYNGDLFKKREELIKPIQDRVFTAVQKVAKDNGLDFIFDKSGDMIMLFANAKYDKSDLVLSELGVVSSDDKN